VNASAIAKEAAIYFALVFGAGFALGSIRVLMLEPLTGARSAELLESPVMAAVILLAARWREGKLAGVASPKNLLTIGTIAAGLTIAADVVVGVGFREMTFAQVFTSRETLAGIAYYCLILLFALAPWLWQGLRARD
jgi:hypothetical protein